MRCTPTGRAIAKGLAKADYQAVESAFDIVNKAAIHHATEKLEAEVGKPGMLFNNAGIMRRAPRLLEMAAIQGSSSVRPSFSRPRRRTL